MTKHLINPKRRQLLRYGFWGMTAFVGTNLLPAPIKAAALAQSSIGTLQPPDKNGVRLPKGFFSRIVASSGQNLFDYHWHAEPDGGATFATSDSGWIYVSNSEIDRKSGGVGALRFDKNGNLIDAYPILKHTSRNCAGGHTPWQTWLSCEEIEKVKSGNAIPLVIRKHKQKKHWVYLNMRLLRSTLEINNFI